MLQPPQHPPSHVHAHGWPTSTGQSKQSRTSLPLRSSPSIKSKGIVSCPSLQKQTIICLTLTSLPTHIKDDVTLSPFILLFFNLSSRRLTLEREVMEEKWGGGGGWRGLASRLRPLPLGLPHPSFRSHPSHLFFSVFLYLYCTCFFHRYAFLVSFPYSRTLGCKADGSDVLVHTVYHWDSSPGPSIYQINKL